MKRKGSREVPSPLKSSFRTVGKLTQENLLSHSQVGFCRREKKDTKRKRKGRGANMPKPVFVKAP